MKSGNWIAAFLEAIQAEHNAADNTLLAYDRDLGSFADYLTGTGRDFASATRQDIEQYLVSLAGAGMAGATRARRLSAIRQIYRFAFEEGWRGDNPAAQVKGPKPGKHLPQTLGESEVDRLLEAAITTGRTPLDRARNTCLMQLLYATGMRVTELVSLPYAAVQGNPEMVLVKGKGGKERLVPLSAPSKLAIAAYLRALTDQQEAQGAKKPPTYLFPSRGKLGHLTRIRFYTLIKEIAVTAGISPDRVTPHVLRHAFATHLLAHGADLRIIQMLLGHADIATTEIYTHVLDEKLRNLVLQNHPLKDG
jgi:integrase/recombinase XerD